MNLRTPLSEARGLGSAKEGVGLWWNQRFTAVALVPLTLWFGFSVAMLGTADYYSLIDWIGHPVNAVLMILMLVLGFWHGTLGIQVVLEDYVAGEWKRISLVLLVQLAALVLALGGSFAVLRIAIGV